MISEGSCDTEDTDFDQINAALLSIRYFFLKYKKKSYQPQTLFSPKNDKCDPGPQNQS